MICCSCICDSLVERIFILDMLNIVSEWADSQSLYIAIVCFHAILRVGNAIGICGYWFVVSILSMEESSDSGSARAVMSLVQFLCRMVYHFRICRCYRGYYSSYHYYLGWGSVVCHIIFLH